MFDDFRFVSQGDPLAGLDCWLISPKLLKLGDIIGSGNFNDVKRGTLKCVATLEELLSRHEMPIPDRGSTVRVAVKVPKGKHDHRQLLTR